MFLFFARPLAERVVINRLVSHANAVRNFGTSSREAEVVEGDARVKLGKVGGSRSLTAPLPKSDYSGKLFLRVLVEGIK